jgi:hypothetical protein
MWLDIVTFVRVATIRLRLLFLVGSLLALAGCADLQLWMPTADRAVPRLTFAERCAEPAVVKCIGFDSQSETDPFIFAPSGSSAKRGQIVTDVKASGAGSLRFEIPPYTSADTSGGYWQNFSDDLSIQFGEGEEFFVQWRQRFSSELLKTTYVGGGGWKQFSVGEGDRPGKIAYSCTQIQLVVQNTDQLGFPRMYHSCGGKDEHYEGLDSHVRAVSYKANQWMTFQVQVKIGRWYRNDRRYRRDSTVRLWVAEEGQPSKLAVNEVSYDLANEDPQVRYGKIWLLPYHTGKSAGQRHPTAYTWYDELIIARARIPDPA